MKDDKNHLNIDLDFLGKDKKDTPKPAAKPAAAASGSTPPDDKKPSAAPLSSEYKYNWKTIAFVGAIILFFGWAMLSGSSSDTDTASNSYTPTTYSNTLPPPATSTFDTEDTVTEDAPIVPKKKAAVVAPVVTPPAEKSNYEICQDRNGYFATYDSTTNSCACASGYSLGAADQCVSFTVARDQSCAAKYPGTSFLKVDQTDGKNICDCVAGSYWNNERTACYSQSSYTQSCVSSYGTGAVSTTEGGKRVCDCGYGYDFNAQRNMCVTTASINAICERDVGRNSRYSGTVTGGKYDCTEPY